MTMRRMQTAGRIVVADRHDRPRNMLEKGGTGISGHGPILCIFDLLSKAGRSVGA